MTTVTAPATGELVHIDPRDVIVGDNVRLNVRLDKSFIESIRERGVLVPIVGYRNESGAFVVLYGQRRTLASVEAELPTIPAYVVESQDEADRLVDQMAENDHRASLTKTERAQGFAELVGLGLTAAEVAKRTATKTTTVKAAVAVVGSEAASKALAENKSLTIEQAASIAEFEDDEKALTSLLDAVEYGGFKQTVESLRNDREEKAMLAAHADELRAAGHTVIDAPDYEDEKAAKVSVLVDAADGSEIGQDEHAACSGHALTVVAKYEWVYPEGGRAYRKPSAHAVAVCTDYPENGHKRAYANSYGSKTTKKAEDMTEEEREAAKAARRDVIDSNKAWIAAEKVRQDFLAEFFTRKSAPRTAAQFMALSLATVPNYLSDYKVGPLLAGLTSAKDDKATRITAAENASPDRAQVLALSHFLAAYEVTLGTHSWRSVNDPTARYLLFLESNGYELSHVEKRAAGVS